MSAGSTAHCSLAWGPDWTKNPHEGKGNWGIILILIKFVEMQQVHLKSMFVHVWSTYHTIHAKGRMDIPGKVASTCFSYAIARASCLKFCRLLAFETLILVCVWTVLQYSFPRHTHTHTLVWWIHVSIWIPWGLNAVKMLGPQQVWFNRMNHHGTKQGELDSLYNSSNFAGTFAGQLGWVFVGPCHWSVHGPPASVMSRWRNEGSASSQQRVAHTQSAFMA